MASEIVGVMGRKRAGKDTFASALVEERGFTRVAFADPMKAAALALDPLILPQNGVITISLETAPTMGFPRLTEVVAEHGWEGAKEFPEVRRTLQRLGTEMGRSLFGEDFWVATAMRAISKISGPVVITDVRFPNEADAVTRAGGTTVRVVRPGVGSHDPHPSETALDGYPALYTVYNTEDAEHLKRQALALF